MAKTNISDVTNQIQKFWAPMFQKELRESLLLGGLVNKDYQGEIKKQGDTVYVSQINAPSGQLKTIGTDADTFDSEKLTTQRVTIQANKRAVAAFEVEDLVDLQSQIESGNPEIRDALRYAIDKQVNDYLKTLIAPSGSAPDHTVTGVSDFNASQIAAVRKLAATAKWRKDKPWYLLLDPSYYSDLLNATTMTSNDYVNDLATPMGQFAQQRFGFTILEDNSKTTDTALAFHPDFMHLVMQKEPQFKLSDLHSNKQFGYLLSVDVVFGAVLGNDGDVMHITVTA